MQKKNYNDGHDLNKSDAKSNIESNVNHPKHYQSENGLEAIDVIEAFNLGFCLGNVVKYVLRCGHKDNEIQELEKAKWYLDREIKNRLKH